MVPRVQPPNPNSTQSPDTAAVSVLPKLIKQLLPKQNPMLLLPVLPSDANQRCGQPRTHVAKPDVDASMLPLPMLPLPMLPSRRLKALLHYGPRLPRRRSPSPGCGEDPLRGHLSRGRADRGAPPPATVLAAPGRMVSTPRRLAEAPHGGLPPRPGPNMLVGGPVAAIAGAFWARQ